MPYDVKGMMHWAEAHPWATGGIVLGGGLALLWLMGAFSKSSSGAANSAANNVGAYYGAEAAQAQAGAAIQQSTLETGAATAQAKISADSMVAIDAANNVTSRVNTSAYFNSQTSEALGQQATDLALGGQATRVALGQQATDVTMGGQATRVALGGQASTVKLGQQNLNATIAQSNNALKASLANTSAQVTMDRTHATSAAYHDYLTTAVPAEIAAGRKLAGTATFAAVPGGGYSVKEPAYAGPPTAPNTYLAQGYTQADAYKLASKASGLTGKSSQSFRPVPPANMNNLFKPKPVATRTPLTGFGGAPRNR